MFLPFPCRSEHVPNRRISLPSEHFVRFLRRCPYLLDISFAAANNRIRYLDACSSLKLIDQCENRETCTGTEIEYLHLVAIFGIKHPVNRFDMSLSEIHHINIIAYARAIRRIIIISEYFQFRTKACSCLCNERQQVLRYSIRQFSDLRRRMRAYGVEIA